MINSAFMPMYYYALSQSGRGGGGSLEDSDIKTLWGILIIVTLFMVTYLIVEFAIWIINKSSKKKVKYLHDYVFFCIWTVFTGIADLCVLVWWLGRLIGKQL